MVNSTVGDDPGSGHVFVLPLSLDRFLLVENTYRKFPATLQTSVGEEGGYVLHK